MYSIIDGVVDMTISIQTRGVFFIPPALIELISDTNAIYTKIVEGDFGYIQRFMKSLLNSGVLSQEKYDELCLDLADIIDAKHDIDTKAKKLSNKILDALYENNAINVLTALLNKDFERVHIFLRALLDSGLISQEKYDELCLELAGLIESEENYEARAKELAKKIGALKYD